MDSFGFVVDHFDNSYADIAMHTTACQVMRKNAPSERILQYLHEWVQHRGEMKPESFQGTQHGMQFATISAKDGLIVHPLPIEMQHSANVDYYVYAFTQLVNAWPNMPLTFDPGCTPELKELFLRFFNPVRERLNL